MANILEKIGECIFNINFWWHYERPIRKSMKRADAYFDEAIETLNRTKNSVSTDCDRTDSADVYSDSLKASLVEYNNMKAIMGSTGDVIELKKAHCEEDVKDGICVTYGQFQACVAAGVKKMILVEEAYKLWKPFVRAATKRNLTQTINVKGDWNVTFGHGENMVILSTPYKGKNTIGVYRVELNCPEKYIIFTRVK